MDNYTTSDPTAATYGGSRHTYMKIEMQKVSIPEFDLHADDITPR